MGQMVDRRRNLAGQVVTRQIEAVQAEKRRSRRREIAGKLIVREKQKLQGCEIGEIRNGTGEAVSLEAQNAKLS